MRIADNSWIINRPIAHRGLHGGEIPENSKAAYQNAIDNGYPIEMDIQLTFDGKLVCFHDDNMARMTGVNSFVWDKTLEEIRGMRLANTEEGIMTFGEFLSFVDGRVPLMIEIKTTARYKEVAEKTVEALKDYKGEFAVQSF
ncbi:MAG: glycerophosphodiester phosphodiesterase, partial [Clostridia bacterium]|nr:glycerophosphodiester phosphodiesterase [Clostridia bacterium]